MFKFFTNNYLLAAFSGILTILSFPPYNFSFLIWVGLVPLFYSINKTIGNEQINKSFIILLRVLLIGLIYGAIFYFGTLQWLFNIFGSFAFLLILYIILYIELFIFIYYIVAKRTTWNWVFILFITLLWVSIEYLKSECGFLKFSWMNLGYSQHNLLPTLQFASILGQYGLSALIVAVNLTVVLMINKKKNRERLLTIGLALFFCIGFMFTYAIIRLNNRYEAKINVALIQDESSLIDNYKNLINKIQTKVDFILLPEYAIPVALDENHYYQTEIKNISISKSSYIIVGSKSSKIKNLIKEGFYNTAFLFDYNGNIIGKYNKINPVQFFDDGLKGSEYSVFQTEKGKIGILICYDMDFCDVARKITNNGAEMLFIPTYDALPWSITQHLQHSAMTSMRAVENGRFIARTASSGISQIIDPFGRITKTIPIGISDYAIGSIAPMKERTIYTIFGYLFPQFSIAISITIFLSVFFIRRKKI